MVRGSGQSAAASCSIPTRGLRPEPRLRSALAGQPVCRVRNLTRWRPRQPHPASGTSNAAAASGPASRPAPRFLHGIQAARASSIPPVPIEARSPGRTRHWVSIYEHRIGSSEQAERIFGDDVVKEYWCSVEMSECGRFAVLYKWDFVHANAVHLLRLSDRAMIPVVPEVQALHRVQVIDDSILILTDRDAPRGRLWIARLDAPTEWRALIPEGDDVLQSVNGIGGRLYAVYSHNASHQIRVFARDGTHLRDVPLPSIGSVNRNDGEGVVSGVSGSWRGEEVRVSFMSFAQPPSIYRYDFDSDQLHPIAVPSTGIDLSDVVTEQVWVDAPDGTKVSMFLVHRGDATPDGKRLVRLSGYGGFNIAIEPRYGPVHAAWLALGGLLAFVNVRGGGEYGRAWHEAATKTKKRLSFTDFIAAARWLVSAGWTTPDRIAARGNSNGGLLVAASANLAPDAFGAVFSRAPILDMLRFPRFGQLSAAVIEYGSPDDPVEGPYLAAYSPYHAIRSDARYPVMAFVSALNDQVAPPHDPLKVVAKPAVGLRVWRPLLLKVPLRGSGPCRRDHGVDAGGAGSG
ncbi:MAG: prolyl oligopeptidase family serine peptidase [Candidatus Eisenbacteria bacterium]